MEKQILKKFKTNETGITLIALVITIVVMLILAGVTINLTLGENGIFTTAQQAAKNYTEAQSKEQQDLAYFTNTVDNMAKGNTTLTSQITGADYGKYINYSVTVEDTVLDKWRVFYNDKTTGNVYIILDGYLPITLIPEETEITTKGTYQAYWDTTNFSTNEQAVATLRNTSYWSDFAAGVTGATAYGSPTNEMFVNSWNENPTVNSQTLTVETVIDSFTDSSKLYNPYPETLDGCNGYWLASINANNTLGVWRVVRKNYVGAVEFNGEYYGYALRPIICLPCETTGTIGSSVSIDK